MKKTRIFAAAAASAVAAAALTAVASAYDLGDKNLGKNWTSSLCPVIAADEFKDVTADSYITITFTADPDEEEYWSIKPVINTTGWPFIAVDEYMTEGEDVLAEISIYNEKNDSFVIESADVTSVTFKVPALAVDDLKEFGMVIQGHSITLHELTISDKAPAADDKPAASGGSGGAGDTDGGDTDGGDDDGDKGTPNTGIEGVAVAAVAALTAAAAVVISRKRK